MANLDLPVETIWLRNQPGNPFALLLLGLSARCSVPLILVWLIGVAAGVFQQQSSRRESCRVFCRIGWLLIHAAGRVRVLLSPDIDAPLTYGLLPPVILLPANADFSRDEAMHFCCYTNGRNIRHFDAAASCGCLPLCACIGLTAGLAVFWPVQPGFELAATPPCCKNTGCKLPQRQAYATLCWIGAARLTLANNQLSTRLYNNFGKKCDGKKIVAIMNVKKVSF